MYRQWKWPNGVTNAEMGTDFSSKGTCQYPRVMSSLVRYRACPMRSSRSSTRGNGNGSGTVTALTFRKSVQSRKVPSDFGTITMGDAQGLSLSSMIPCCRRSSNSLRRKSRFSGCSRYGAERIGCVFGSNSIWCTPRVVFPGLSEKISANSVRIALSSACSSGGI